MELIIPGVRTDLKDFWKLSDVLTAKKLEHTPFLAFLDQDDGAVKVQICKNIQELLTLPDDTPVLCQWAGKWRSDFFQFEVGDARDAYSQG